MRNKLSDYSLYVLKRDDARFGMKAGDIFLGAPYAHDSKTSVAFRISDGYRPECNQYNDNVRALTQEEAEKVIWGGVLANVQ
jgi:hypothetical protein